MTSTGLPPGRFHDALTQRARSILWCGLVPLGLGLVWGLTPPTLFGAPTGTPPGFVMASEGLMTGSMTGGLWIMLIGAGLLILLGLRLVCVAGTGLRTPLKSSPARTLENWGDPVVQIAAFEVEAVAPVATADKGQFMITRSWLFLNDGLTVVLLPLSEIAWVYGRNNETERRIRDFVGFAFQQAGVIDGRQRRLLARSQTATDDADDRSIVLHTRPAERARYVPSEISRDVGVDLESLILHFLHHAPHVVIGHDSMLEEAWKADPQEFARRGRALGGLQLKAPEPGPVQPDPAPAPGPEGESGDLFASMGEAMARTRRTDD